MTNLDAITFIQKHGMDYVASVSVATTRAPGGRSAAARRSGPPSPDRCIGGLLACPLLLFLAAAFYYPLAYTLAESVTPEPGTGWTLANYAAFLGSRDGLGVLALTLWLSLAATLLSLCSACRWRCCCAAGSSAGRALQFLMMLPITIPALVGALGLLILYDRTGWINVVLLKLHVIGEPLPIDYTIHGLDPVLCLDVLPLWRAWSSCPASARIDPALEEAGRVHGRQPAAWCSAACCCRCCAAACGPAA